MHLERVAEISPGIKKSMDFERGGKGVFSIKSSRKGPVPNPGADHIKKKGEKKSATPM